MGVVKRGKMAQKVASLYAEISADTRKLKQGLTETKTGLTGASSQMGKFKADSLLAWGAIGGVVTSAGIAIKKVIDTTIQYGKSVDDLSRALGTSTEEASKLIQVADDLRIEQGQLQMAFRYALNKGVAPTIDGIKQLAVQYQSIKDPVEKAQFAMDKFGARSGLQMQKMLELTTTQFDEMAQSAENAGLVLDEKTVKATKDMWLELDTLKDKMEGMKIAVGIEIIPFLSKAVNAGTFLMDWNNQINNALKTQNQNLLTTTKSYKEYAEGMVAASVAAGKLTQEDAKLILAWAGTGKTLDDLATSQDMYEAGLVGLITNTGLLTEAEYDLSRQDLVTTARMQGLSASTTEAGSAAQRSWGQFYGLSEAIKRGGVKAEEVKQPIKSLLDGIDRNIDSPIAAFIKDLEFYRQGGGMFVKKFEEIKTALDEGKITPAEAEQYTKELYIAVADFQEEIGQIDATEAATNISETMGASVQEAKEWISGTDSVTSALTAVSSKPWWIDIYYKEHNKPDILGGGSGGGDVELEPGLVPGGAHGLHGIVPAGYPNDSYYIRATSGERVDVTPAGGGGGGGSRGDVYVIQNFYDQGAAALGMAYVETLRGQRLDASMGR